MFAARIPKALVGRPRAAFQLVRCLSAAVTGSKEHIDGLVKNAGKVVVFMKGTPDAPRCGFSNAVIQILKMHGVDSFDAHNVLDDEQMRQGTVTPGSLHMRFSEIFGQITRNVTLQILI